MSKALFIVWFFLVSAVPALARIDLLEKLMQDPFRIDDAIGCISCHQNESGGGPLTEFGQAFDGEGQMITPMLRAQFQEFFGFHSTRLASGLRIHFSDPENKYAVFERDENKFLVDLNSLSKEPEAVLLPPNNLLTFFVASKGLGRGGHLSGLAGADSHCQSLAESAGSGDITWRAYLSTSFNGKSAINAGDRIGSGPWFNSIGQIVAKGVSDLHENSRLGKTPLLTEKGEVVKGRSDNLNHHDILTGTLENGTAAVGMNCQNWTSDDDEYSAMVSHHEIGGKDGNNKSSNSSHVSNGCSQEAFRATSGESLLYCFAAQ